MSTVDRKRNSLRKRQGMGKDKAKGKCWCCRRFLAFLFSHIGLGFLVFAYSLVGAFIFRHFEEPFETSKVSEVWTIRNITVHNLWTETLKLNVLYKENWTSMASKEIEKFQQNLIEAVKKGYDGKEAGNWNQRQWSLSGSWMYSLTVISTIGYGNRPRTSEGKLATIVYAIIGIPLMLLFLSNVGHMLANVFKYLYGYCCNCSSGETSPDHQNLHSHHHLHDHYHVHHIALNDVSPTGHLIHCNSTGDPYRTTKCYSACNSNSQREQYGVGPLEAETKICSDIGDHHSCAGTLNRAHSHSHHSILKGANNSSDPLAVAMGQTPEEEHQNVTIPIVLCMFLITGYVLMGAGLFYVWEGWSILDGSYIAFCLLSTIGFGDLMPGHSVLSGRDGSQKKLIITSAYIIGGMALIAMSFNLVHEQVLHKMKKCGKKWGLLSEEPEIDLSTNETHDEDFDV